MREGELSNEEPVEPDAGPLDLSDLSLGDLDRIDRPVLAEELRRLLSAKPDSQCAFGGFQSAV